MASIIYNKIVAVPASGNKNPAAPKAADKLNLSLVESSIQIGVGGFFKVLDSAGGSLVHAENTAFTVAQAATFSSTLGAGASTLASAVVSGTLSAGASTLDSAVVTNALSAGASTLASAVVSGTLSAGASTLDSAVVTNALSAGASTLASAVVSGTLSAGASTLASAVVTNALSAGASTLASAVVTNALSAGASTLASAVVSGTLSAGASTLASAIVSGTLSAGASTLASATITNNLTVTGNLTVNGTTTSLQTLNTQIKDNIIVLNDGEVSNGVTAGTSGISIDRGSADDAVILWDEATDKFNLKVGVDFADLTIKDLSAAGGTFSGNIAAVDAAFSGAVSFTKSADTLSIAVAGFAVTETYALDVVGGAHFDGHARFARTSGSNNMSGTLITPDFMVAGKALYFASEGTSVDPDLRVRGYSKFHSGFEVAAGVTASIAITGVAGDAISFSTANDGHIHLDAAKILRLSASLGIATNHTAVVGAAISANLALSVNAMGNFVAISAAAKNALVLGVSLASIANATSSKGKVAEFGKVAISVESGATIAIGDLLYLSASEAGKVTNVIPTDADSTAYMMGVALAAPADGAVSMAMHRQFLYNN